MILLIGLCLSDLVVLQSPVGLFRGDEDDGVDRNGKDHTHHTERLIPNEDDEEHCQRMDIHDLAEDCRLDEHLIDLLDSDRCDRNRNQHPKISELDDRDKERGDGTDERTGERYHIRESADESKYGRIIDTEEEVDHRIDDADDDRFRYGTADIFAQLILDLVDDIERHLEILIRHAADEGFLHVVIIAQHEERDEWDDGQRSRSAEKSGKCFTGSVSE
jgi:hypothetical protein